MKARTVYVVTWDVTDVGGFEWRDNAADAHVVAGGLDDSTARVFAFRVPAKLADEDVTDWLDEVGWSDGTGSLPARVHANVVLA